MPKNILITGTSTGLGISIAVQAAKAGHKVYATMRNLGKSDALKAAVGEAGVSLELLQLDVQDPQSVQAAIDHVHTADGHLDVLINNAGAGYVRTTEQATEADINWVMDVNFMGVVRCTKAALPKMRERGQGHIITITSVGGLVGQPFNEIYCAAKFAAEGYMESLASYVGPSFGLHFSLVEPGGIKTEFANNVLQHVAASGGMLEDAYLPLLQKYIGGAETRRDENIYQTADEVGRVVMNVIHAENPPLRTRTSDWSDKFTHFKTGLDPDGKKQSNMVFETFLGG